jgi:hypothetical protein
VFMAHISFCWCSSSTGISTMWASFIWAIVEQKWDKVQENLINRSKEHKKGNRIMN